MENYDEELIEEINNNFDLLGYVQNSIELEKRGNGEYFGRCPLHVDNTPSFSVTPSTNRFYCFGCTTGGGIVKYLTKYEKLSFMNAMEKSVRMLNIDISKMCSSETVKINRQMRKRRQKEAVFERNILNKKIYDNYKALPITEWVDEGIKQEVMDLFEIKVDDSSNRIIYPVYDTNGNFINIKGRTRFDDYKKLGIQKYMNYYKIGIMDYLQGINITLQYIEEIKEILIFESLKSVMKLFGHDIKNSISVEKHTLTKEQIRLLIKLGVDIVFCYDSDVSYKSGEVKRNIDILKRYTNVYIIEDKEKVLGGEEGKNSPIDLGIEIWNTLYSNRKKVL